MRLLLAIIIISLAGLALSQQQLQQPFWLAKIKVKCEDKVHQCLGAIITDNCLVTTASCINKCNNSTRTIRILVTESKGKTLFGRRVKASEIIIHPELNTTGKMHDIALVKFKCPEFEIDKISLNDNCTDDNVKLSVNVMTNDKFLTYQATTEKKRNCNHVYNWGQTKQVCIIASSCSDKSGSLISDVDHNVLHSLSLYASKCDELNSTTIIAALNVCKYFKWIASEIKTS